MEPLPNYNLLQAIDPTKIKVPISERFAKLTLSSNKKQQQKCNEPDQQKDYKIQKEKRDSVTRNISKQFENENLEPASKTVQNPLLRSESSKETEYNNSPQEVAVAEDDLTMEPLEVTGGDEEFNTEQNETDIELLSQQIASLVVGSKPISLSSGSTCNLSVFTDIVSTESLPSSICEDEKIHIVHHIPINIEEAANRQTINLNLSSHEKDDLEKTCAITNGEDSEEEVYQDANEDKDEENSDGKDKEGNEENGDEEYDEEDGEDEEDEPITISDTSESHHESENEIMATSSLPSTTLTSENLSLPSLVANKAERVAAFLRDVSIEHRNMNEKGQLIVNDTIDKILDKEIEQVQEHLTKSRQIATADTESMTADVEEEMIPKSVIEREKRLKALDDVKENKQPDENRNHVVKDKQKDTDIQKRKVLSDTNVNRLANDETLDNTINTDFNKSSNESDKTPRPLSNIKKTSKYCSPKTPKSSNEDDKTLKTLSNLKKPSKYCSPKTPKSLNEEDKTPKTISNLEKPSKYCSPKTPKTCRTDVYRLANDETQCNTDFTLSEKTPKTPKENPNLDKPRRMASLDTEDFTDFSMKEKSLSPHKEDPKEKENSRQLAYQDTMTNSDMSAIDDVLISDNKTLKTRQNNDSSDYSSVSKHSTPRTPNTKHNQSSYASTIDTSNEEFNDSVPEASITILETDDDDNLEEEKAHSNAEKSDDKKLSNSFHRDESSDDSEYEQQISKIQMGMASINISAKINIKIHIPNQTSSSCNSEDEQNDKPDKRNNYERQSKLKRQITDQTAKSSEEEKSLRNDRNNESNEQSVVESEVSNDDPNTEQSIQENESSSNHQSLEIERKNVCKEKSYNNHSYKTINQTVESAAPQKTCKQKKIRTPKEKTLASANKSSDSSIEVVEDEKFLSEAEKLLTQLYGKSWQTPDVIRTLKRSSQSCDKKTNNSRSSSKTKINVPSSEEEKSGKKSVVEESILDDFSIFRRNIVITNLDSTRLATPKSKMQQKTEILTEPRNRRKPVKQINDAKPQPQTERKPKPAPVAKVAIHKQQASNDKWRRLIDNYSNSEGDNASDDDDADDSWSKNASELEVSGTDSDFEISPKAKSRRIKNNNTTRGRSNKSDYLTKVLNKSKQGEIVYLDLSKEEVEVQDEVPASPPVNHDLTFASRLQDILKTCRHEDKAKLPSSNKKSKRKLFTPNFGDDEFESSAQKDDVTNIKEINQDNACTEEILEDSGNCPFDTLGRPKVLDLVNKQLESVKTGKPIFLLTPSPPKKQGTKSDKKIKNNSNSTTKTKTNDEAIFKTPLTVKPKGQQAKSLKDLQQTPDYKYSFLKSLDVTVSKTLCHPDALYYRDNYRTKKEDLSKILYDMYNEKLFDNKLQVPIQWNKKLLNTAGRCLNKKKFGTRSSVVELSEKVLTSADRLRCTLIHELCHAATWIFHGEGGHGSTWKEWARKANYVFPEIPKIGVCHQYDIEYKYTYKCTLCAAKSHAHSKSKKVENIRCSYCHGAIEIFLNKKDKDGNVIPTPVKEATGFAKFVKDNYKKFKRDDLKHADVMKLLSNEFASLKVNNN